ncbi:MAG TPA: tyrosine-type recombinase/integrase [Pirellulaceae bacterium]|jgi:integrase|nr:tyrosine-type recombinase/integrase [Pirellulaceae bacterium]
MAREKPQKPYPEFPLGPAANGQWQKKIGGKVVYFGPWADPDAALARYQAFVRGTDATTATTTGTTTLETTTVSATAKRVKRDAGTPGKPYPDYPLFAHRNGQWAKTILSQHRYFGPWSDPQAALDLFLAQKDDLYAGREPQEASDGITVKYLVNHFLTDSHGRVGRGEIKLRTFGDYKEAGEAMVAFFGPNRRIEDLRPDDFARFRDKLSEGGRSAVTLGNWILRCRVLFKYGEDVFELRVRFGRSFKRPRAIDVRGEENEKPEKFFEAAKIHALLGVATVPMRAMILLGVNCGFGNGDVGRLEIGHLDLDQGWHRYGRPKTGVVRRFPLWPETVAALRLAIDQRPELKDPALSDRVFLTKYGLSWFKETKQSPISLIFGRLVKKLKLPEGRGFYALRHVFQTVGDDSGEQIAVKYAMGHAPSSRDMAAVYRERVFENGLVAVSDHVRAWFLAGAPSTY